VALWLLFLATRIWAIAKRSVQPPVYDSLSYYVKAKLLWAAVTSLKPVNPFNVEPSFRPPGTVLMSYPVGFTEDFHGFYFRSVFIPIFLLVAAVYCAGFARRASARWNWNLSLIAILLSTSPMFFHFERSDAFVSPLIWGLVDNFLAAVSGIAAALCIRSMRCDSLRWWIGASLVAAFSAFVKPAGFVVMALTGSIWFVANMLFWRLESRESHSQRKRLLGAGTIAALLIFGATLWISLHSNYMSDANLSSGSAAIKVMGAELRLPVRVFVLLLRASFGYVLPILLAFSCIGGVLYFYRWRLSPSASAKNVALTVLVAAPFTCAVGLWFWIVGAQGATQIRYFYPFATMTVIFTLPILLILLEGLSGRSLWFVRAILVLPAANLLLLLTVPRPAIAWQQWSGVNLTSGSFREEILLSQQLISDIRTKLKRTAVLYSFYPRSATAVFESVGEFEANIHPDLPTFQIARPVDWRKPSVVRTNDLVQADYILFTPVLAPATQQKILAQPSVHDFSLESELFAAWFTEVSRNDGVETVVATPSVRLLQPIDRPKFESHLSHFVASHSWPASFTKANPPHWWSAQELETLRSQNPPAISDVKFGGLYEVNALALSRDGDELTLSVWWQRLQEKDQTKIHQQPWFMFVHFVDRIGKPVSVENIRLAPDFSGHEDRPIALDVLTFPIPKGTSRVGIGIQNGGAFLIPDRGIRDWNSRRLLLPLP
jgi:hypothetical protein